MSKRSTILLVQQLLAFLITLTNAALTTWAFLKQKHFRQHDAILIGSCHSISRIDAGVHVLLNVLSTLFLGAGNYCMQILSAPSREEVVRAHAEGRFMDIGIPNLRNLWNIARTRTAIWAAIGVVTTVLHLFWNSAFYVSIPFVVFPVVTVTSDFLVATDNWEASHPIINPTMTANISSIYALHEKAKNFTRLENRQCMERYMNPLTATSELVLVSTTTTQANNRSSLIWGWISGSDPVH